MKKILAFVMIFAMILSFASCGGNDIPTIGIAQYGEHDSLDNCRIGFLKGLEEAGLKEGVDFKVNYQNAGFDDNAATQIAQNFSANNVKIMVAIATPCATACYAAAEDKDIPIVFTAITDPEKANLVGGNATGTSDKLPVEAQLDLIRKVQPDAKVIGIVYTTSEPNSVSAIAEYKEKAPAYGFTIEAIGVTAQSEVTQAIDNLITKGVDCFSNLTDNNVVGVLDSIIEKTNAAKVPVYGSEVTQVEKGCVAAAGIEYVELGVRTGKIAAKILKGEAKAQDIPYETITDYDLYVNSAAVSEIGLTIPEEVKSTAIEVKGN